jgi:hypothetical protein
VLQATAILQSDIGINDLLNRIRHSMIPGRNATPGLRTGWPLCRGTQYTQMPDARSADARRLSLFLVHQQQADQADQAAGQ